MHQRITPTATMIMSCLVATGLIGVAACGPPPSPEGNSTAGAEAATLTVAETTAPSTLDPQASGLFADRFAWQLSYECLMYTTPEGSVEPALASEYRVSEDGLTYSFTLREGVAFSNGDSLDADDVVYTFQRLKKSPGRYDKELFPTWEGVSKTGDMTVEFTLDSPDAGFIYNMGNPLVWGCAIMSESAQDANLDTEMIGTGPWVQTEYKTDTQLTLERNSDYWGEGTKAQELSVLYMPSMSTQIGALNAGEVDIIFPDQGSVEGLQENGFTVDQVETDSTVFLQVNDSKEPFSDPAARRALALSIDRQALADLAYGESARPSSYLPPSLAWAPEIDSLTNHQYDSEQAKQILQAAGYTESVPLELIYISGYDPGTNDLVATLQSQMNEAGFDVTLKPMEAAAWSEMKNNARHQLSWNAQSYYPNPYQYVAPVPGRQGPVPEELQKEIDKARAATSEEEYHQALTEVAEKEAELVYPTLTLLATDMFVAYHDGVSGVAVPPSESRTFLTDVSLQG